MAVEQSHVALVSADHPVLEHFNKGHLPYHTICGRQADWETKACVTEEGRQTAHFGVFCTFCNRSLMLEETRYVDSGQHHPDSVANGRRRSR